jgi:hypothetical protein
MKPFDEIEIKNINILTGKYRELNNNWERWTIGNEIDPEFNINFLRTIKEETDNLRKEILKYLQVYDREKLTLMLNSLILDINRNIELYKQKETEINKVHENKRHNWYKMIYEHSLYIKKYILDVYTKQNNSIEIQDWNGQQNVELLTQLKNIKWNKDIIDLCELIYVLQKSESIYKNGKNITQKDLTELFNNIFNTDIKNISDNLNKGFKTYKRNDDNDTYIKSLYNIIEQRIEEKNNKK